ncbi:MAG: CPBP family intramembrane metalloprotease [Propionibacteriaceae bacterium]|nr:CPBP family intramembrane metalloprotease [Propionibacteriaceae bacterium]
MVEFVVFSLPSLIYLAVRRRDAEARATLGLVGTTASGWLLGLAVAVVSLALGWAATLPVPAEILHGPGTAGRIVGVVSGFMVVLRAVGEEILFRGFLQGIVARRWGAFAGIVVQGVAFWLPHLMLLTITGALVPLVIAQFAIGLLFGWLRHRTGSIAPGAAAHALANVIMGLV